MQANERYPGKFYRHRILWFMCNGPSIFLRVLLNIFNGKEKHNLSNIYYHYYYKEKEDITKSH